MLSLGDRFWSKVSKSDGCWTWTASKSPSGYGRFRHDGKHRNAHRLALEERLGAELPGDIHACHHCDNPSCVRPDHLFPATQQENMNDRNQKGRASTCGQAKLNPAAIRVIRHMATKGHGWQKRVADAYRLNVSTVRRIVRREMWAHVN